MPNTNKNALNNAHAAKHDKSMPASRSKQIGSTQPMKNIETQPNLGSTKPQPSLQHHNTQSLQTHTTAAMPVQQPDNQNHSSQVSSADVTRKMRTPKRVPNDLSGTILGKRYRLEQRIGIGGMAVVYRAKDITLDRDVAVKMMLPQYAEDEKFKERFYLEAKSAAQLQSSNIVAVYDWGQDETTGSYYIVMELLHGTDLKHAIIRNAEKTHEPLSCQTTAEIAIQVCDGLQEAHNHGIVHRDIKPQNIMILNNNTAKIMDFGIARPSDVHITTGSNVLGTAQYISPEQTRGLDVTPASDIYSLGIVMYECVTGRVPFDGSDAVTVALKQAREMPVPPIDAVPEPPIESIPAIDPIMNRIILKCMAKNPQDRFESAAALRDALEAYLDGKTPDLGIMPTDKMPALQDDSKKDNQKPVQSKKRIAVIIAIIIAVIAVGATATVLFMNAEQAQQEAAANANMTSIPDVVGLDANDAQKAITDAGLSVGNISYEYSDDVDENKVISQSMNPDDGRVNKNTAIDLVVSKGPEPPATMTVPSLTGMTQEAASNQLAQLGFDVKVVYDHSDTIEAGKVMDQSPASNTSLQVGSTVTITVSQGSESVSVPDVTGKNQTEAKKLLSDAGLTLGTVSQSSSDDVDKGLIISQSATAGSSTKKGSTIDITVSTGKETINVGSLGLIGKTLAEAKNTLNTYGITSTVSGSTDLDSIVQDISPTTVTKGETVTITTKSADTATNKEQTTSGNGNVPQNAGNANNMMNNVNNQNR